MPFGGGKFEIWLADDRGSRIQTLNDVVRFDYTRTVNAVGAYSVTVPADFNSELLQPGYRIEFWYQSPDSTMPRADFVGLIESYDYTRDNNGLRRLEIGGSDMNAILRHRIVAYDSASSQASKSDAADDMMKEIVRENLGSSATDTDRQLSSTYFRVAADFGLGPTVRKAFSRRNVLEVLQEIADAAYEKGTAIYFDVVRTGRVSFEFRTYKDQPGSDRRARQVANPVIVGSSRGNLLQPHLTIDYSNEKNVVYVGGQGAGAARMVREREDTTRSTRGIFSRREEWKDQRQTNDNNYLDDAGDAELDQRLPVKRFTGVLLDTKQYQYGLDWFLGDRCTVDEFGLQFDVLVKNIYVRVGEDSSIEIISRLEWLQ